MLDLFAGTGALGLEAMSRGASELFLVDQNRSALELIHRNIALCRPQPEQCSVSVIRYDLRRGLPPEVHRSARKDKFDLIFLDPPYSLGLSVSTLSRLGAGEILKCSTVVVVEERSIETLPESSGVLQLMDRRVYGDTGFWLYSPINLSDACNEARS